MQLCQGYILYHIELSENCICITTGVESCNGQIVAHNLSLEQFYNSGDIQPVRSLLLFTWTFHFRQVCDVENIYVYVLV